MLNKPHIGRVIVAIGGVTIVFLGVSVLHQRKSLRALGLLPINTKFDDQTVIQPSDLKPLLNSNNLVPVFGTDLEPAQEPQLPAGSELPSDAARLGFGSAKMLIDTEWATIRYLGANPPAGLGLEGKAFEEAQRNAFATVNDSTPVFTAAWTINEMMDKYYVPLLTSLSAFQSIPQRIKIQGAYFAPNFKYRDGTQVRRDNAYIVNLQSLYIFPSSCFDDPEKVGCKVPFMSTGHDPTVIGHELGHVIFNHIRREHSLDGFQWFAVNEGYADYFSASFFAEPILGRTWRYNRKESPYLRKLIDLPTLTEWTAEQDAHDFSTTFSSALWRARERIVANNPYDAQNADRIVLQSIQFLGETQKTRLGDASTAVLKAAEVLGFPAWKEIYRDEFQKAEISLASVKTISLVPSTEVGANVSQQQLSLSQCGVIAFKQSTRLHVIVWILLSPLLIFGLRKFRRKKNIRVTAK